MYDEEVACVYMSFSCGHVQSEMRTCLLPWDGGCCSQAFLLEVACVCAPQWRSEPKSRLLRERLWLIVAVMHKQTMFSVVKGQSEFCDGVLCA